MALDALGLLACTRRLASSQSKGASKLARYVASASGAGVAGHDECASKLRLEQCVRYRQCAEKVIAVRCDTRGRMVQGDRFDDGIRQSPQAQQIGAYLCMSGSGGAPFALEQREVLRARYFERFGQLVGTFLSQDPVADVVQQTGKPSVIRGGSSAGEGLASRRGVLRVRLEQLGIEIKRILSSFPLREISADRTRLRMVANPKYVTASLIRIMGLRNLKNAELVICKTLLAIAASALTMSPMAAAVTVGLRQGSLQAPISLWHGG